MNDQAKNWVWKYEDDIRIVCKKLFSQTPQTEEDMVQEVLLRISQRKGLGRVGDRTSWIYKVAKNECMNYFRELKRHPDWNGESLEDPGVRADEEISDARLDKEAGGSAEDTENKTDEPEKIDPMKVWRSFKRHDPDRAAALERSLWFVASSLAHIRGQQRYNTDYRLCRKALAALRDITRRMEKKPSFKKSVSFFGQHSPSAFICQQIREIVQETKRGIGDPVLGTTIFLIDRGFTAGSPIDRTSPCFIKYHIRRAKDVIVIVPDPLYVLYRIWNRILKKGKYGNRKLLKVLFFAFQKLAQEHMKDDTVESFHDDTFNSLTEETNFETLRVMSYQLNKGYSDLADFIFRKSVRPSKRKTAPTDEEKPARPSPPPPRPG